VAIASTEPNLIARLPDPPTADALLDAFVDHVTASGLDLYPAQEEAILEILAGNNVVLNTPTGSGKSLVAEAAHFAALAERRRSFYTAPIKALVSEKFFALCSQFGTDQVGMITGDAAVNPGAPIICCTAEIVANLALREGVAAPTELIIADEFHFYADPQRGWAWQVPLLELPQAQFLLMSATLGATARFEEELTNRTGRETVLVKSVERPVPLDFEYRHTAIHESVASLLDTGKAPIYIVHFSQREATEASQALTSVNILSKPEKAAVKEAIGGFRFDSPIGKDLRRYVSHGIGVHHAGMLPKYRLLVEKLAQQGLLKVICGTDTLGVGVNVPIRTVLFTQLCKYDGQATRLLTVREFQQIAGRAGRKGFDDHGFVWVQAPPHWVENQRAEEKAQADPKKRRKTVKKKPPDRGYAHWNEDTFNKLVNGQPETLVSSFTVTHQMLMNLLDRPGDGCGAVRTLLTTNHEPRRRQRRHITRAISIYRSLLEAGVVEILDEPDQQDRLVRVNFDLQSEFALHQPLSLFALEAMAVMEPDDVDSDQIFALDVLSVIESVLENPGIVLAAQLDRLKGEAVARMKSEGIEYEQRMEELDKIEYPKPLADFLYGAFDSFRQVHPWVGSENVKPKAIARELFETAMTFGEYVNHYKLKRAEGVLLRYLTDAYKGLKQNVPEDLKTDSIYDLTEWLGEVVRQVDSSLLDEWERLTEGEPDTAAQPSPDPPPRPDITRNMRAFTVMIRNEVFRWVQALARRDYTFLATLHPNFDFAAELAGYWEEHEAIDTSSVARGSSHFALVAEGEEWTVTQTLADPEGHNEWVIQARVDLDASREEGRAVVNPITITRL
jgi:superfamily II RNA helicase